MAIINNSATRSYNAAASAAAKKKLATPVITSGVPNQNQTATAYNQIKPVVNDTDPNAVAVPYVPKPEETPTGVPTAGSVDDYMNNMKGGFGKVTINPLGTLDDYKKQAGTQLQSNLSKTLAGLLANYTNNLAAYEGQKSSVGLNSAAELAANNRNTTASQNNYSNSTLGRGMGRSTIATTGIGEIGVIGDRINSETEARKTAALNAIEQMKLAAKTGYEANVLSANDGYNTDVEALANDLYNKQVATNADAERFNLGQDTALYTAAINARDKALANQNDIDVAKIAYAKSTDVADKNNATKVATTKLTTGTSAANNKNTNATKVTTTKLTTGTSKANNAATNASKEKIANQNNATKITVADKNNATKSSIAATKAAASAAKAALKAKNKKMSTSALNVETQINQAGVAGKGNIQAKLNYLDNDVINEIKTNAKISSAEKTYLIKKVQEVRAAAVKQQKQFESKTVKTKNTKAYMGNHGS